MKYFLCLCLLLVSSTAWAQSQPTSCSDAQQRCLEFVSRRTDLSADYCTKSFAMCMKTGNFVGTRGTVFPVSRR
jgi:hypothetical protein